MIRPVPLARRRLLLALAGAALLPGRGSRAAGTIRITAEKFKFTPSEVRLKRGETVELELVSLDRLHGFSAPDFGVRADVIPGGRCGWSSPRCARASSRSSAITSAATITTR